MTPITRSVGDDYKGNGGRGKNGASYQATFGIIQTPPLLVVEPCLIALPASSASHEVSLHV